MDREERKLYKSGRKNPNGYRKKIYNKKLFFRLCFAAFVVSFAAAMLLLAKNGIYSWDKLKTDLGVVDGVKPASSDFSIHYLDVGQSDCSIVLSNGKVMMIDTGTVNEFGKIQASLLTLNIDTIDYLIITHPHDDHMGNAASIIENYTVLNIIMPRLSDINMVSTNAYEKLLNTIIDKNVHAVAAEPGYKFNLGNSFVSIFTPLSQDKNLNNMSVVTKVTYGDTSFLFQGDAEKKVENALLKTEYDFSADVIKLGHHGSKTSSTEKYLQAVNPCAAIISAGADNTYGHPSGEVLERLEKLNIDEYITFITGNVTLTSDGRKIIVKCENGEEKTYER